MHRIALGAVKGASYGTQGPRDPSGAIAPRAYLFDEAFDPAWDESIVDSAASGRSPLWWRMAGELYRRQGEYDAVLTWGEKLTLGMLLRYQLSGGGKPHVAMMYQFEKPNIRLPLSLLKRNLHAVVTWSSVQRRALIEKIGFPSANVYLIRHYVDQLFYSPRPAGDELICAVGAEMRDYTTLLQALSGTGLHCHLATDHARIPRRIRMLGDRRVPVADVSVPGAHVTCGRKSLPELRDLYARSRFTVVPLLPSDTDNGVTCILESMAMGKPVICSATRGQVDVIQEGVTGHYVPVGDADALRRAILSLWSDPARASEMGRNARAYIERYHSLEMFTATVRSATEASLDNRAAPDTWWE